MPSRHGLTTGVLAVLPNQNPADLERIGHETREESKLTAPAEHFFVDLIVKSLWKIARVRRLEAAALDRSLECEGEPDACLLHPLEEPGHLLDKLGRYATAAESAYAKAVCDLAQLRTNAQGLEKQNKAKQAGA